MFIEKTEEKVAQILRPRQCRRVPYAEANSPRRRDAGGTRHPFQLECTSIHVLEFKWAFQSSIPERRRGPA